jgi:hypothetical protein
VDFAASKGKKHDWDDGSDGENYSEDDWEEE